MEKVSVYSFQGRDWSGKPLLRGWSEKVSPRRCHVSQDLTDVPGTRTIPSTQTRHLAHGFEMK